MVGCCVLRPPSSIPTEPPIGQPRDPQKGWNTSWVMKVMFKNCGRKRSPKIPPPPELKKTSFAFFSVRPLEKRRLSGFRKSTRQILKGTFLLAQMYVHTLQHMYVVILTLSCRQRKKILTKNGARAPSSAGAIFGGTTHRLVMKIGTLSRESVLSFGRVTSESPETLISISDVRLTL